MIFHLSIPADDPAGTAHFLAALWQGRAYPFPPFGDGSWTVMAGDERNSAIEIYPRGTVMAHGGVDAHEVQARQASGVREQANHAAIATPLDAEAVMALAERSGVPARICNRGPFQVIEIWIDGCIMFEALPPDFQQDYLRSMTIAGWEGYLAAAA